MSSIDERVCTARKRVGLTQVAFGRAAGVSKVAVSQWEKGITVPGSRSLLALQRELDISPEWIIHGTGDWKVSDNGVKSTPPPDYAVQSDAIETIKQYPEDVQAMLADLGKRIMKFGVESSPEGDDTRQTKATDSARITTTKNKKKAHHKTGQANQK